MISKLSLVSLLIIASTVYPAPAQRADYSYIPQMALTLHNERDTALKALSVHMPGGDFWDGKGSSNIKFVHLTAGLPVDIELSLRVVNNFSTKHAHVIYHLMTTDGKHFEEASADFIHNFDSVCPEGGVGHEFSCKKGSGIKNLKLKLHNEWTNADSFKSKDLMLSITIESADKDTLLSTWVYAKLH